MAALTIGRVGLNVTFDTAPAIGGIDYAAIPGQATTRLTGWIHAASLAETKAIRDELYAQAEYADVVPVTYAGDSTLDGFYRVRSLRVTMQNYISQGLARFQIALRRVGDSGSVGFQSRLTTALRTNSRSVVDTTAQTVWTWPFLATSVNGLEVGGGTTDAHLPGDPTSTSPRTPATRPRSAEIANTVSAGTPVSSTFAPVVYVVPEYFYDAGCEIYSDSYQRAGLWTPNTPDDFSLTNGTIRVKRTSGANSRFTVENWIYGSGWESDSEWKVEYNQTSWTEVDAWDAIRILHNRPEYAAVRLYSQGIFGNPITLDLAIRRGIPIIYGYLWTNKAPANGHRIGRASADGSTSVTGGIVQTSAHSDGSKWGLFAAASGVTFDTTNDYLELANPNTETDFGIGMDIDNSGTWTIDDEVLDTYYGLVAEDVKAVVQ